MCPILGGRYLVSTYANQLSADRRPRLSVREFPADLKESHSCGMLPRDALILVTLMTSLAVAATVRSTSADLDSEDYEVLADSEARSVDKGN